MGKSCVICGKPSGMYPLCREHLQMKEKGEVVKCEKCGQWHFVKTPCACSSPTEGHIFEPSDIERRTQTKDKCIVCGGKTEGTLFCRSCYYKFKNKELLIKVKNCTEFELLSADYEGNFTCKDGHIVKSKSEREIDNYLFDKGIPHAYEKELPYGPKSTEVLHPDFFLPNYLGEGKDLWIEFWGYSDDNENYAKTKKFKMDIYKKLGITLICLYEKTDIGKIDSVLDRKLNKEYITEHKIYYEEV